VFTIGYVCCGIAEQMSVYNWLCLLWYSRTDECLCLLIDHNS